MPRTQLPSACPCAPDVYHALAQPLTALHCALEIAIREQFNADQHRETLEQCLRLADDLLRSTLSARSVCERQFGGRDER